jgi:Methane oxygenase PmoA
MKQVKSHHMTRTLLSVIVCCLVVCTGYSQRIATLEVAIPSVTNGIEVPVSVDLDNITFMPDSSLTLVEVKAGSRVPVVFQIEQGEHRILHWLVKPAATQKKLVFELVKGIPAKSGREELEAVKEDGMLTIHAGTQNLLRYYFKTVEAPAGANPLYRRSGFIHPLWTPHGQELTRIQPPDHPHHYGIWNPWTHVLFEKDTIDFWNIGGGSGTVRFAKFTSTTNGAVFAEYDVLHEHVVLKGGKDKVAMNELQHIRVYSPDKNQDYYIVDMTMEMNCATASPLLILEYRYAGLGWRTTQEWDRNNSEVITSEGKGRKEADGSKAKWCIVQGKLGNDYGGAVMMSFPANYNHPEPMRVWPENQYDRGDMYAMFAPTKDKDWLLEPGKKYVLKYRWIVFNGHFTKEKAESAWKYYAAPPTVTIKK